MNIASDLGEFTPERQFSHLQTHYHISWEQQMHIGNVVGYIDRLYKSMW